jgi:hypothetical protein
VHFKSDYYKHTQWIFINYSILGTIKTAIKRRIFQPNTLFERNTVNAVCDENIDPFSAKNGTRKRYSGKSSCNTD